VTPPGASVAEVVPILGISVLFSAHGGGVVAQLALLAAFLVFAAVAGAGIAGSSGPGGSPARCSPCRTRPPRSGCAAPSRC
jgi:hypothetical protein